MTLFEDITIKPESARIDCFRYTDINSDTKEFTVVEQDGRSYFLKGTTESQLYQYLGLTIEGVTNLPWEQRADFIKEAFTKPFMLRCADDYPYAVVSLAYTTVKHKVAWGWAQDALGQHMLSAELMGTLSTDRKLFARFLVYKDWQTRHKTFSNGFFIMNSVRNTGGLSFGQSIYLPDQDVFLTGPVVHSIAHVGGLDKIEDEFKSTFLASFFLFNMPNWELLKSTLQQGLTPNTWRKYRLAVKRRMKPDMSRLDYIATVALVAQGAPAKTRLEIERLAYKEAFDNG